MFYLKKYPYLLSTLFIISLCSFFLISPQLYKHSIILGNDSIFHMNRVFEYYSQLKNGTFNYFQSLYGFQGSGRIVNAVYGPDFALFQALLLMFAKNWFRYQLLASFLCFFTSGICMYLLGKSLKLDRKYNLGMSILYMSSTSVAFYAIWQSYASWGAAFMPLIFIPAVYWHQYKKPIHPLMLALPVSILLSVHLVSALLGVVALVPFFLIYFIKSDNKYSILKSTIASVLITITLTANTISALLEVYTTNKLITPHIVKDMLDKTIQFSFNDPYWEKLGLIFSVLFIFQIVLTLFYWNTIPLIEKIINTVGMFFLFISTSLLPWNDIANRFEFVQIFQFPQRFAYVSFILLIIGFVLQLQRYSKGLSKQNIKVPIIILFSLALFSCTSINSLISEKSNAWHSELPNSTDTAAVQNLEQNPDKIREAFSGKSTLDRGLQILVKPSPDYLPMPSDFTTTEIWDKNPYNVYSNEIIHYNNSVEKTITKNGTIQLNWQNNSDDDKNIQLPVIAYSRSNITLNGVEINDYETSSIGSLIVKGIPGNNTLTIGYKPSIFFKISILLKFIGFMCLLVYVTYHSIIVQKRRY